VKRNAAKLGGASEHAHNPPRTTSSHNERNAGTGLLLLLLLAVALSISQLLYRRL